MHPRAVSGKKTDQPLPGFLDDIRRIPDKRFLSSQIASCLLIGILHYPA
jgi:hypothetical protein